MDKVSKDNLSKDYCGYEGNKVISDIVPDVVFGVTLSDSCKRHDDSWKYEGVNKTADKRFRYDIEDKFYRAGKPAWLGFIVAWWYYIGVRLGGIPSRIKKEIK